MIELSKEIYILFTIILVAGYVPFNRLLKKGYLLKSNWDDQVPLVGWFVYPYLPLYLAWMIGFGGTLFFRSLVEVQQVFVATLIATTIGYTIFFFFPTYVITEYPQGNTLTIKLLQSLHILDKEFNAFPSMHVFMCVLLTLFCSQWYPPLFWLFGVLGFLITISTVLTKRHYLYDIAGGLIVGLIAYGGALYVVA